MGGRRYTVDNIDTLPENIRTVSVKNVNDYVCFSGRFATYSNFYKARFKIDQQWYNSVEQYLHAKKAELYGNDVLHYRIMQAVDPRMQKALGDKLRGREAEWEQESSKVMEKAIFEKFNQNPQLREPFKAAKGAFVECNPHDREWGIGLGLNGRNIGREDMWLGQNKLGQILDKVKSMVQLLN